MLDTSSLELLETVTPVAGACLLFNHDVMHEGEQIIEGTKYIIRAEIMFKQVGNSGSVLKAFKTMDASFLNSTSLYQLSDQLEKQGMLYHATDKYLKALSIQVNYSPSVNAKDFSYEIVQSILMFADYKSLLQASLVNRRWQYVAMESDLWKVLYPLEFGSLPTHFIDPNWYFCFRDAFRAKKRKHYLVIDVGASFCRIGFAGSVQPLYEIPSVYTVPENPHNFDTASFLIGEAAQSFGHNYRLNKCHYNYYFYFFIHAVCHMLNCLNYSKGQYTSTKFNLISFSNAVVNRKIYAHRCPVMSSVFDYQAAVKGSNLVNGILVHSGSEKTFVLLVEGGETIGEEEIEYGSCAINELLPAIKWRNFSPRGELKVRQKISRMRTSSAEIIDPNESDTYEWGQQTYQVNKKQIVDACEEIFTKHELHKVILKLAEQRKDLLQNIVLSGGNTFITNFETRLQEELTAICQDAIQIVAHPQRHRFAWLGASKIAYEDDNLFENYQYAFEPYKYSNK